MRSCFAAVTSPLLADDACLRAIAKVFHGQAFVTELAFEALIGAVLPRLARLRKCRMNALIARTLEQPGRYELRSVIHVQGLGRAPFAGQPTQHFDHRQTLELLSVRAGIENEVVNPDAVDLGRAL